ncbi:hypothetical protein QQF64_024199 [Cirrhinus molitorella]|uniref:Jacalin-type lectin domain-containing protein n=1 Tax=Cirrhinus molitorella TaxID=172907 RepID=A0ABR3NKJ3_9TELE
MATTLCLIGGNGGHEFEFTGKSNGASLHRMWVWVGPSEVKAVRAWLSDGRSETFGRPAGDYTEFEFQPGERITTLSLWGNGMGTRLGGIRFKTDHGRCGWDIDCMGFLFLEAIQSVVVSNVSYPTLNQMIPKVAVRNQILSLYPNEHMI